MEAYAARFDAAYGFYERLAAVQRNGNSWHIGPYGRAAYEARWAWCGNFQEGRCPVQDRESPASYYHIDTSGRVRSGPWLYAGDYRDGVAAVRVDTGRWRHVDPAGVFVHDFEAEFLDAFHKGYACARDARGWFHIEVSGRPAYNRRYAWVEPFYNGRALAKRPDGEFVTIASDGEEIARIAGIRDSVGGPHA